MKRFLAEAQFKAMIVLIILGVVGLTLANLHAYYGDFFSSLKHLVFSLYLH